ncbi:hypothetical protein [Aestuariivita sp.]|uniref:hypothetical protein n=1 Tax=Aestuariivita sp. TaxID=1872407 RepID=UPI00217115C7|nr:hypothetical protein [Aestuariivita sp.]MCE8007683.1 hypothetical protein [Aestuariivita sp.]
MSSALRDDNIIAARSQGSLADRPYQTEDDVSLVLNETIEEGVTGSATLPVHAAQPFVMSNAIKRRLRAETAGHIPLIDPLAAPNISHRHTEAQP